MEKVRRRLGTELAKHLNGAPLREVAKLPWRVYCARGRRVSSAADGLAAIMERIIRSVEDRWPEDPLVGLRLLWDAAQVYPESVAEILRVTERILDDHNPKQPVVVLQILGLRVVLGGAAGRQMAGVRASEEELRSFFRSKENRWTKMQVALGACRIGACENVAFICRDEIAHLVREVDPETRLSRKLADLVSAALAMS